MFNAFAHYLSYGATDQKTLRDLRALYDGLVVPGTIAAFQHEGTGGFVLTLSATVEGAPYVIDSRFPLFQRALSAPKKSHQALADLLGSPDLVRSEEPEPGDFTPAVVRSIAENWVAFNESYQGSAGKKFDKYAARLDEAVVPRDASAPDFILAPYLMAEGPADGWWQVSEALFEEARQLSKRIPVLRVVAATDARALGNLLASIDDERAVVWVSGLKEIEASAEDLALYLNAISEARERGIKLFSLYGGFFAVLAAGAGLAGASHGIGFGEHRDWPELSRSGPAPPRFYLPSLHRYISQQDAQRLHLAAPELAECRCEPCDGRNPIELEYHDLMKHSVNCRAMEIDDWGTASLEMSAARLEAELEDFLGRLLSANPSDLLWNRMSRLSEHLNRWIKAIRLIAS